MEGNLLEIEKYIDHTLLKSDTTVNDIEKICREAIEYGFFSICISPAYVSIALDYLKGSSVKICTVVGFPLGSSTTQTKVYETVNALEDGADEIDMVINIGFVKSGMYHLVKNEIERVKSIVRERCLKVILETCYLNEEEIEKVVKIAASAGADYIKTSTGFGSRGASFSDIEIMKKASEGTNLKIKASGGIRDIETALKYLEMGVSRIGTSNGVAIINKSNNIQAGY